MLLFAQIMFYNCFVFTTFKLSISICLQIYQTTLMAIVFFVVSVQLCYFIDFFHNILFGIYYIFIFFFLEFIFKKNFIILPLAYENMCVYFNLGIFFCIHSIHLYFVFVLLLLILLNVGVL